MKYFKMNNTVFSFNEDGTDDDLILDDMIQMTDEEIDRHLNPKDYMTDEEKRAFYLASLRTLTRRQFKLGLLEAGLLDQIENSISIIEDSSMRARIQIEYTEATEFHRTSESMKYMCSLLDLTEAQVDQMWEEALKL